MAIDHLFKCIYWEAGEDPGHFRKATGIEGGVQIQKKRGNFVVLRQEESCPEI